MNEAVRHDFDQFWRTYPRKVGKLAAAKEWARRKPKLEDVLVALAWQMQQAQWQDMQFIPHPKTYLSQGRWLDEPPVERRAAERWWEECDRLHSPRCANLQWHQVMLAREAKGSA